MAYNDLPPLGQTTKSASLPVTIASDQDTLAVSVSGVATAANQSTIIGHVDGIEGLLTTIDADTGEISTNIGALSDAASSVGGTGSLSAKTRLMTTQLGAIQTAVETIDNAIAGSEMQVDVITSALPTGAATSANQTTIIGHVDGIESILTTIEGDTSAIQTAVQLIDDTVFADDAAYTLGTSKANAVAGVAVNMDGTDPTAVSAEGDAATLRTDTNRLLLVNQTHPRFFRASADYASAQTNATVQAAPGAGLSLYITDVIISNGATSGNITLLDGSSGSVILELYPAINGGLAHSFRNPLKLTANTLLAITSTTVTTHTVTVTGYIAP